MPMVARVLLGGCHVIPGGCYGNARQKLYQKGKLWYINVADIAFQWLLAVARKMLYHRVGSYDVAMRLLLYPSGC